MHRRALHLAGELELNKYEVGYTHKEIRGALWNFLIVAVSIIFAAFGFALLSGITYLLIPLLLVINERLFTNAIARRKR